MNLIYNILKEKSSNNLSIYFTAGFPELHDTTKVIRELSNANVDFIEVGLPYSDPLADGPTIQKSSQKALQNGINLDIVFDQLLQIKRTNKTPLVLMGYLNQCRHGNMDNDTGRTRVSFDFRVIPKSQYNKEFKKSSNDTKMKFTIGDYYKSTGY